MRKTRKTCFIHGRGVRSPVCSLISPVSVFHPRARRSFGVLSEFLRSFFLCCSLIIYRLFTGFFRDLIHIYFSEFTFIYEVVTGFFSRFIPVLSSVIRLFFSVTHWFLVACILEIFACYFIGVLSDFFGVCHLLLDTF